ncbi:hypothetical protein PoB_000644900 [Plakobranchus ocellatus]|uniref:Uncharacterized protein n=1 Tax=Plakobranchus ocellatus TaxID=259542 RepID=A0AAV3YD12_9GAST|nr:hypothetical protein PoB_000644900 [Plakobranchus ocellatus]
MKFILASVAICLFAVYAVTGSAQDVKQNAVAKDYRNFLENIKKIVPKLETQKLRKFQSKVNTAIDEAVSEIESMDRKDIVGYVMNFYSDAADKILNETKYEHLNKAFKVNIRESLNETEDRYRSLSDAELMDAIKEEALEMKDLMNSIIDMIVNRPDDFINEIDAEIKYYKLENL